MKMTWKVILVLLVGFCGLSGFGYWRYQVAGRPLPVAQFGFIHDTSDSIQNDCGRTEGFAKSAIVNRETGPGSKIALFALGTRETASEPRLLGEYAIPRIRRVIEGQRTAAREQDALLSKIKTKCEGLEQTTVSPVFQAVKRGVEHMQNMGLPIDQRYLFVQTDGEETENAKVKESLNLQPGFPLKLPAPINNEGVHITFCGIAETVGEVSRDKAKINKSKQRDDRRSDRIREVWTAVFTNPELVSFQPYCSR
jgi:hypothetical protein